MTEVWSKRRVLPFVFIVKLQMNSILPWKKQNSEVDSTLDIP